MSKAWFICCSLWVGIGLMACNEQEAEKKKPVSIKGAEKPLEEANRYLLRVENEAIESFKNRYGWDMKRTGSGLQYMIFEEGTGPKVETGNIITLNFSTALLDGTKIYSSETDGPKTFKVGYGGVESGLEEAVLLMRLGDKANLIIPSHLAYGLLGDQDQVPPRATLVYQIEIINLK